MATLSVNVDLCLDSCYRCRATEIATKKEKCSMELKTLLEEHGGPCFAVDQTVNRRWTLTEAWFRPPPDAAADPAALCALIDHCPVTLPAFTPAYPAREYGRRVGRPNAWALVRSATEPLYDTSMFADDGKFLGEKSDEVRNVLAMYGFAPGDDQHLLRLYRAWSPYAHLFSWDTVIAAIGSWSRHNASPRVVVWRPRRQEVPFELRRYEAPDVRTALPTWPWRTWLLGIPRAPSA